MSSSAARARDDDQLVVGALLPAVHGRFTSSRSYLSPDLSSSYRVAFIILSCDPTAGTSPPETGVPKLIPKLVANSARVSGACSRASTACHISFHDRPNPHKCFRGGLVPSDLGVRSQPHELAGSAFMERYNVTGYRIPRIPRPSET